MLGKQIGEEQGKVIATRVLSTEGAPKLEVSFHAFGKLLGLKTSDVGTYTAVLRPDGFLFGEGQGVISTKGGDVITWTGSGVGRPKGGSAASWRGAVYYQTSAKKLARLNGIAAVFEYDVDAEGRTSARLWEWS